MNNSGVRIVCAANKLPTGDIVLGARHYDQWMHQQIERIGDPMLLKVGTIQGFIDNRGNFLTREEAWIIAEAAGQIIRRVGGDDGRLFSENLY